ETSPDPVTCLSRPGRIGKISPMPIASIVMIDRMTTRRLFILAKRERRVRANRERNMSPAPSVAALLGSDAPNRKRPIHVAPLDVQRAVARDDRQTLDG